MKNVFKSTLLLFFNLLIMLPIKAQYRESYFELYSNGMKSYYSKDYKTAGIFLSKAADLTEYKPNGPDGFTAAYNAACSWSLAGQKNKAFDQLNKVDGNIYFIPHYPQLIKDSDFKNLYDDNRWKEVCEKAKKTNEQFQGKLNRNLVIQLDSIRQNDQVDRLKALDYEKKFGGQSKEAKDQWKIVENKDKVNLAKIEKMIADHGWPGINQVGFEGNQTVFLVIQHADIETQEKYLPQMKLAVASGNAFPKDYAYLIDRVRLREGKKQVYGSQLVRDKNSGKMLYPAPLDNPDSVDVFRQSVGLEPMASYLKENGLEWNVQAYKEMLSAKENAKSTN